MRGEQEIRNVLATLEAWIRKNDFNPKDDTQSTMQVAVCVQETLSWVLGEGGPFMAEEFARLAKKALEE